MKSLATSDVQKSYDIELKRIGNKIKALRIKNKMTQQNLSDFCDVDIRTIQRIEVGEQNVALTLIMAISEGLGVRVSELLDK
jgi:transcriptional regulator with XRE-family HTH domain